MQNDGGRELALSDGSLKLFDLIGDPVRLYTHFCKLNDGQPRLLLSLMGFNLVFSKGRIFPHKQGAGPFIDSDHLAGYSSVLEACVAVLEQTNPLGLPEVQAFGHTIRRVGNGFRAVSETGCVESESLIGILRDLKRRRDADLKIYIHVGMPKTATTLLQRRIFPNISGVHFLRWDTDFFAHGFQRIKYSCPFSYIEEIRQSFAEYLESFDEDKILISDESITGPGNRAKGIGSAIVVLREVFPQANILLVLREQLSQLRSFYLQNLRSGMNRSAANFVRYNKSVGAFVDFDLDVENQHIDMKFFEYKDLIWLFKAHFKNVGVMLYEQLRDAPELFAAGLSEWLGAPVVLDGVRSTRENVGLGKLGVTIFKLFNGITAGREWFRDESRVAGFVSWVNRMDAKFHFPYEPFPHWLQVAIRQRYAATNEELGAIAQLDIALYWGAEK